MTTPLPPNFPTDATDFTAVTHTVTFSDSEVSGDASRQHCLDFDILDDDILEIDETFEIDLAMLQSVDVPVTILPHTTIVTILDDDGELVWMGVAENSQAN